MYAFTLSDSILSQRLKTIGFYGTLSETCVRRQMLRLARHQVRHIPSSSFPMNVADLYAAVGNWAYTAPKPNDGKYRIISFDGGGLRSLFCIILLERLIVVFPDLLQRVDLFCGTSGKLILFLAYSCTELAHSQLGGAIIAAALACGRSPRFIKEILFVFTKHIFTRKARQVSLLLYLYSE